MLIRYRRGTTMIISRARGAGGGDCFQVPSALNASSFSFPADAVLRVLQNNASLGEFITNLVRAGKIPSMARVLPLLDQLLDLIIEHFRFRLAKDAQHAVEFLDRREYFLLVLCS